MGNDADTEDANKQIHLSEKDTGISLHSDEGKTAPLDGDNEDDNDMAIAHVSAINEKLEDVVNKSRGSYFDFDDKTAFMEANGNPENKGNEDCVVSNNGNSMAIVEDTMQQLMLNNVEIPPPQDGNNLLLAEQPFEEPPPANQLNNQGINPTDGNNGVDQEENINMPVGVPFFMNVDPPQMIMGESPILPFPPLPEGVHHLNDTEETGIEDGEQSVPHSSHILISADQEEHLVLMMT